MLVIPIHVRMKGLFTSIALVALFCSNTFAGGNPEKKYSRQEYIEMWKDVAISNMKQFHIPASIILAQGILESNCGNSVLATEANNHFGIKCHEWEGNKYFHDDDAKQECFRSYEAASLSYADHAVFLTKRSRYAFLFALDQQDYKSWAYGLKKAGYATNPNYPELLIKIIEESGLHQYDDGVADSPRVDDEVIAEVKPKPAKLKKKQTDEVTIHLDREILVSENKIKYIEARAGDSPAKIAKDLDVGLWQILKYNDIDKTAKLNKGEVIYVQPKRRKGKLERHTLKKGEDLWEVSQMYGVKLTRLYKMNKLEENQKLKEGFILKLR